MTSLFLSYARDDDEHFVRRLYEDLTARGFDVWFDRVSMPARRLSFTQEIKDAIAAADRLVLVVGPAAAVRPYVLKEWREALLMDKCVNPIVRRDGGQLDMPVDAYSLIPEELRFIHAEDFRRDSEYPSHLQNLVGQLSDPAPPLGKLVAVPALPSHYCAQPDRLRSIREALLIDLRGPLVLTGAAARMGVQGMGGIGKSVLANALARDTQVRLAFPDGVFWISVGQQPTTVELQRQVAMALGDEALFNDVHAGKEKLRGLLANRAALLVVDNVWRRSDADAFDVPGQHCKLLITTRDAGLVISMAGTHYQVQLPTEAEAQALLASAARVTIDGMPALATEIVRECGRLPLALALCGGMVKGGTSWRDLLDALREHDLEFLSDEHAPEDHHRNVWRTMELSVRVLPEDQQRRFAELAVFAVSARVPEAAALTLWAHTGNLSERLARRLLVDFSLRSLVQLDGHKLDDDDESASVGLHGSQFALHDLLRNFAQAIIIKREGSLASLHAQLLGAYAAQCGDGWSTGPNDGYFFQNITRHFIGASRIDELATLLTDLSWLEAKHKCNLVFDLPREFREAHAAISASHPRRPWLSLLEEAITREVHSIARHYEDYPQALFQSLWNLCWWYDCPVLDEYRAAAEQPGDAPRSFANSPRLFELMETWLQQRVKRYGSFRWLRSVRPPHLPLMNSTHLVFSGHLLRVTDVTFANDDSSLFSSSRDQHVAKWDLDTAELVALFKDFAANVWIEKSKTHMPTLEVLDNGINSIALAPEGDRLATASGNGLVRLWPVAQDADSVDLRGHLDAVWAVDWSPDGRLIVSGSDDGTIRLWDVNRGEVACASKERYVKRTLFSPDGRLIVATVGHRTLTALSVPTASTLWSRTIASGIAAIAFLRNGHLAVATGHGRVVLLDPSSPWLKTRFSYGDGQQLTTVTRRKRRRMIGRSRGHGDQLVFEESPERHDDGHRCRKSAL